MKNREEKEQRLQTELRHLLESLAILLSTPSRFVESHENVIKDRIREILAESKDQALVFCICNVIRYSDTLEKIFICFGYKLDRYKYFPQIEIFRFRGSEFPDL